MRVLRPRSAAEALRLYARHPQAVPLAGGTDFMVSWNAGAMNGRTVLDLWGLGEWRRVAVHKEGVRLGALVTHAQIQAQPVLARDFPLLAEACATVGAAQIQNRGTIGGNIANASPAGDSFPPLAVYDARVIIASAKGGRSLAFLDVFAGVKKTVLAPGELIEAVELPFPKRRPTRQLFRKVGQRAAQTISKTVFAGLLSLRPDGSVEDVRLAFGSVAPTVRRLPAAERHLMGQRLSEGLVEEAVELLPHEIKPIDDIRSTAQYRLAASQNLLRAFLSP